MKQMDLATKLMMEKYEELTGKTIEVEELPYKYRVSVYDNSTYQREELAVVTSRRELILLFTGMIEGAKHGKAGNIYGM